METTLQTVKKTKHLARNIILSVTGGVLAAVVVLGIIFINPIITLLGGNGKIHFKDMKKAISICEKNPDVYVITENKDNNISYEVKSGLGSVSMSSDGSGGFSAVTIVVDSAKVTAPTTSGMIDQVTTLANPALSFADRLTLASHALQEAEKIPEITTDSEFTINRKIGEFNVISTKESGSDLVTTVFTK